MCVWSPDFQLAAVLMTMDPPEPIAIIGYGFRAPDGAHKDLYSYLASGKCAWSPIPRERFDQKAFYHPDSQKQGTSSIRGGHFLEEDVFAFDAPFFKISPQEAKIMDPQHRLLLECAYEAIEQSGASLTGLAASNVGVFAAGSRSDYEHFLYRDPATMPTLAALGATTTMFANRLSYCFDLKGPSVSIDTACSSSITAVHLACQSLRQGECSTAMVGASSLVLSPEWLMAMSTLGLVNEQVSMAPTLKTDTIMQGNGLGRPLLLLRFPRFWIWTWRRRHVPSAQAFIRSTRGRRSHQSCDPKFCHQSRWPYARHYASKRRSTGRLAATTLFGGTVKPSRNSLC